MQCPKCGTENPDDSQLCHSCSFTLASSDKRQSKHNYKKLLQVFFAPTALFCILALFLKPVPAFFAALFAFCFAIAAIPEIIRINNKKKKIRIINVIVIMVILIPGPLFAVIFTFLSIDAAPIPNDYTINDLKSAEGQYNQTFVLLHNLSDKKSHYSGYPIGFSTEDIAKNNKIHNIFKQDDLQNISQQLQKNEKDILLLWEKAQKGRDIFTKLDSFPEIADLTQPKLKIDIPYLANIIYLVYLYQSYICLQSCKGNHEIAINELIRLDSLFRKMNLNAHSTIIKLVCLAYFATDINIANFIINNPETPTESLLALKQRITPLSNEHTSLRNSLIFEYLIYKYETIKSSNKIVRRNPYFYPLKLNSSLRLYRNIIDKWIADEENQTPPKEMRVWPAFYPNLPVKTDNKGKFPWYYKIYNPAGIAVIEISKPALERIFITIKKLQAHSDMLQVVLNKRLGEEVSLKARYFSDEYIIDIEKKLILSPGPDREIGTKDDIKLPINPELLGWRN
jgi:energy-coupling factor transporter transmembrane protein EcfT